MDFTRALAVLLLIGAVYPSAVIAAEKEPLVQMPLRTTGVDRSYYPSMESALTEGLSSKYTVFAGKRVSDKVEEIFKKVSEDTAAGKECDDTKCLQNIAIEFQAELVVTTTILKNPSGFFLTLNIANVLEDEVIFSRSETCEGCTEFQVITLLKEMSNKGGIPPKAKASGAILSVTSNPFELGADIFVDGEHKGNIPTDIKLPAGKHLIDVKGATASGSKRVTIKNGKNKSISVALKGEFKSDRFAKIREEWLIRGGLNIGSGSIKPAGEWETFSEGSTSVVAFMEVGKRGSPVLLRLGVATYSATEPSTQTNPKSIDLTTSIIGVNWEGKNPVGWFFVLGFGTLNATYSLDTSLTGGLFDPNTTATDSGSITYTEVGYRWDVLDNFKVGLSMYGTTIADVTLFDVKTQAGFSGTGLVLVYEW